MNDVVLAQCTVVASECSGGDLACTLQPPSVSPLLSSPQHTNQPATLENWMENCFGLILIAG